VFLRPSGVLSQNCRLGQSAKIPERPVQRFGLGALGAIKSAV
jgi:hypothetical protein